MKEHLPKIGIFTGMIILQIGLAYGLVTYILPPNRVQQAQNFESVAEGQISKDSEKSELDGEDAFLDGGGETEESLTQQTDQDSIREAEFYNELSDYLEEEIPEEDLKGAIIFTLDDLIINPAQTRGTRYLVMSMNLLINGKKVEDKWEQKLPAVSDAVNTLISRKTVLWLSDIDNRPYLREEIKLLLESVIGDVKVLRVYFTKYLFQ